MQVNEFLKGNKIKIGQILAKMFNYLIKIEYEGTNFVGCSKVKKWQINSRYN